MEDLSRRRFIAGTAAAATAVAAPFVHAQKKGGTLRFVPHADLKILDPIWTTAYITRNHGYMIYDTHRWRQWDAVMWDNRCALHRGRSWDSSHDRRVMRRTTVAGDGPTAEPPFATRTGAWEGIIPPGIGV